MRKTLSYLIVFNLVFMPSLSFAQRRSATSKKSTTNIRKSNTSTTTKSSTETEGASLSCSEKYNLCMDNICVNSQGNRYYCSTAIDSFETVEKDGEKIRIGNDLYTLAKGLCADTLRSCELKERNHIETAYKAQIQEDLLTKNYLDAMNAESDETQTALLQEYIACMQPLCGNGFSDCFTIKNVERRASNCENVLAKSSKPLSVKKAFYNELQKQRSAFCSNTGGYIDYDTKVCKVKISYGSLEVLKDKDGNMYFSGEMEKEVSSKYFNIGEMVECSQEYFQVINEETPSLARAIADFALGAVRQVAGAALVVAGALVSVGTLGIAGAEGIPMISNGSALLLKGTANQINGMIKVNSTSKIPSACFIDGRYITSMGNYFRVDYIL